MTLKPVCDCCEKIIEENSENSIHFFGTIQYNAESIIDSWNIELKHQKNGNGYDFCNVDCLSKFVKNEIEKYVITHE